MTSKELERLKFLAAEVEAIAKDEGLTTVPNIDFEIVPAKKMIEAQAYGFPVNFSHWKFGADYDKISTIYRHTQGGIAYEQVWNFDEPRALLVETNPFALNVTILGHVFGHVDFNRSNRFLLRGREISNVAEQARNAARRFQEYEDNYGQAQVERMIDAGMSIQWHLHPDPFFEEPEQEEHRQSLIAFERAKLMELKRKDSLGQRGSAEEINAIEDRIKDLQVRTPVEPTYDLLNYLIKHSPRSLKPWAKDVLSVIRNQARVLLPNTKTKMLNEGWATYWHARIMRRLFKEKLITPEEHGIFAYFHSAIANEPKISLNVYLVGSALFEHIEHRWNKGRFGIEYDNCDSPHQKENWDTGAGLGRKKIFEVRAGYTDRMAVEEFFTPEFIRERQLYIYRSMKLEDRIRYEVVENDPEVVKYLMMQMFSQSMAPIVKVVDGNHKNSQALYLRHIYSGFDLDPRYRDRTLEQIQWLWDRRVFLETSIDAQPMVCTYDGKKHNVYPIQKNNGNEDETAP